MSDLLHKCMTKATTSESDQVRHSFNWVVSRRGMLKVYQDQLECGDWVIPNAEIKEAVLTSIRSMLFLPGYVLRVKTENKTYQFGLNGGKFWRSDLPFPVKREHGSLRFSMFSRVLRLGMIAVLLYLLWQQYN